MPSPDPILSVRVTPLLLLGSLVVAPPLSASTTSELLRSEALYALGGDDYTGAITQLERAVAADPSDTLSHFYHGVALTRIGRYLDALNAFEQAGDAISGQPFERGLTLYRLGRHSEALPVLRQATVRTPDNASAHYYLGLTLLRLDQPGEALAPLEQAMSLQADLAPSALYLRAGAHAAEGEVSRARSLLHEGVKAYPDSVYAGAMLDRLAALEGQADVDRPWRPVVSIGLAHDSNVGLFADDSPLPAAIDSGSDSRFELNAGGDYRLHQTNSESFSLGYRLFASKHTSVDEYDLLRHQLGANWLATSSFGSWGVDYRFHATNLGSETYSNSHTLMPSLIFNHSNGNHSLLRLTLLSTTYADDALSALEGQRQNLAYRYIIPRGGRNHWYLGAETGREDTDDAQFDANLAGFSVGLAQRLTFAELRAGLDYQFRTFDTTTPTREDETRMLTLGLSRSLSPTLTLEGSVIIIDHPSNWVSYDYTRNLVNITVRWQP